MADKHLDVLINTPNAGDRYDRPWRGRVSRTKGDSAWVVIAGIAPKFEFGPCDVRGITVERGDSVLVMFIGGEARDPIIARRLQKTTEQDHPEFTLVDGSRPFAGPVGGVDPVGDADLTTKSYVDDAVASGGGVYIDPFLLMGS